MEVMIGPTEELTQLINDLKSSIKNVDEIKVNMKKLRRNAVTPTRGSEWAAGYDLYANLDSDEESAVIQPHTTLKVPTGIAMAIPNGYFGAIFARSGLATKKGLRPANCVGVIDADYRGEIIVALHNDSDTPMKFDNEERIAQIVIMPCLNVNFILVDDLDDTERGGGGFGSTDKTTLEKMIEPEYEQFSLFHN